MPLCVTSAFAGAWAYLMGTRGRILEKLALTLTLAGGVSNLYDPDEARLCGGLFQLPVEGS